MWLKSMSRKACLALFLYLPAISVAFHAGLPSDALRRTLGRLHMSTAAVNGSAPNVLSSMKKASKVLSVGLEYSGKDLSATELSILSMQLRKCKSILSRQLLYRLDGLCTQLNQKKLWNSQSMH